jgi:hypothetical protein
MHSDCPHCYGIGYDYSGYACTCQTPDVARVGQKMQAAPPLFGQTWRSHLRLLSTWALSLIGLLFYAAFLAAVLS